MTLGPLDVQLEWRCASVCVCPDSECVCVSDPPLVVMLLDAGLGTTLSSVVYRVHPLGMDAAVLGHAMMRPFGIANYASESKSKAVIAVDALATLDVRFFLTSALF